MRLARKLGLIKALKWLFRNGNEYPSITGGWAAYAWSYNTATDSGGAPSTSNNGAQLVTWLLNLYNSAISGVIRTGNMIDLTGKTKIKVHIWGTLGACDTANGGYQEVYLFTRQSSSGNWNSGNTAQALIISHTGGGNQSFDGIYELSVSGLTGLHYVCIGVRWKKQNGVTTLYFNDIERAA